MLSLSFLLLSSSGNLQSSSNTPHITLSEFGLEVIFRSQRLDFKNYFSLVTLHQSTLIFLLRKSGNEKSSYDFFWRHIPC